MKAKLILHHFNTVFTPAVEIASCIIHQLLVIYSLQLLALLQIHTFYATHGLWFLFLRRCSMTPAYFNFSFFFFFPLSFFCDKLIYLLQFGHQVLCLMNDAQCFSCRQGWNKHVNNMVGGAQSRQKQWIESYWCDCMVDQVCQFIWLTNCIQTE